MGRIILIFLIGKVYQRYWALYRKRLRDRGRPRAVWENSLLGRQRLCRHFAQGIFKG